MGFDDYKVVLYRNQPDGWVAEIPAIPISDEYAKSSSSSPLTQPLANARGSVCAVFQTRDGQGAVPWACEAQSIVMLLVALFPR
jgi:hypothetical protein